MAHAFFAAQGQDGQRLLLEQRSRNTAENAALSLALAQPQPGQGQGQGQWQGPHRVFGSATLTNPLIRLAVMGRVTPAQEARLVGFRRDGGDMRADQGAALPGKVLAVDDAGLLRLDRYERLGTRCRRDLVTPCRSVQCMGLQVDPR